MYVRGYDWSAEEHATKHGFTIEQIVSVFGDSRVRFSVQKDVYALLGRDKDGNLLEILYRETTEGKTKVFHCAQMRESWKKRYKRHLK